MRIFLQSLVFLQSIINTLNKQLDQLIIPLLLLTLILIIIQPLLIINLNLMSNTWENCFNFLNSHPQLLCIFMMNQQMITNQGWISPNLNYSCIKQSRCNNHLKMSKCLYCNTNATKLMLLLIFFIFQLIP